MRIMLLKDSPSRGGAENEAHTKLIVSIHD